MHDENYDIDIEEAKKGRILVKDDEVKPQPPTEPTPETFYDDIDKKYALSDEEMPEEEELSSPPVFEDSPIATGVSGHQKDLRDREYLNRRETIYSDPEELPSPPKPPKREPNKKQKALPSAKKDKDYSGIMTLGAIIIFAGLVVLLFLLLWKATGDKVKLTDTEKAKVIEMSTFLSLNEEYVNGMNQLSEQKRTLLDSYFKDVRNRQELALDLIAIKSKESQILALFEADRWADSGVNTARDITYEFMASNLNLTSSLIDMLGNKLEKSQLLNEYNDSVKEHMAQLYTLNEYVKTRVNTLEVPTKIESNIIQIDLTNIR